jgi:hypothetical protein
MAIDLSALFGQQPDYSQFISPAETQRMQSNASQQALLNAAIAMLGASGTQPRPISTGQALGGALAAGMGGYNEAFDRSLKQMVTGIQLSEYKKKQDAQQRLQAAIQGATREVPQMTVVPTETGEMPTPQTLSALTMPGAPKRTLDLAKLQEAILPEAITQDPLKFLELQAAMSKEKKLPSDIEKYQYAVAQGYPGTFVDYEKMLRESGASKTEIKIPTEGERKAGVLANILDKNISQLQAAVGKDPTAVKPNVASSVVKAITGSDYLSGSLTPAQRQIVEGAQLDILDAALTLRTGAAYTREQLEGYRLSHFPTLSDKPEQIKAKQQRLENLLDSAFMAAGRATPERVTGKSGTSAVKPNYRFDKTTGTIVENN